MLTDIIKDKINNVDVLTDFDEVMINNQSIHNQILAYFSFLPFKKKWNFSKAVLKAYKNYAQTKDVSFIYPFLKDALREF